MAIEIGNKVYLNLEQAVAKNTSDINDLKTIYGYKGPYTNTSDIENPVVGAMYLIGSTIPYGVYQYNSLGQWAYMGPFAATGQNGITPHIGDNGNWYIANVDTNVHAQGNRGYQGPAGRDGSDGQTPYIGSNGNWWIGNTDTGTHAQGPKGDPGEGVSTVEVYFPHNTDMVEITEEQYNTLVNNKESILMITADDFEGGSYYYNEEVSHYDPSNPAYELSHPVWGPGSFSQDQPIRYIWRNIARVINDEPNNKYYVTNWGGMQLAAITVENFYNDYQDQIPHGTYHLEVTYNGIDHQTGQTLISAQWVLNNS